MKCRDSLYQSLRSDLGVLITHLGMSGHSSTVRLNFLCGDSCVRLSNTRATLAQVSAEVSAVKASRGDDTSRSVFETHRAVLQANTFRAFQPQLEARPSDK